MLFLVLIALPMAQCAMPGTFLWKPRLGIDLAVPTTDTGMTRTKVNYPNKHSIAEGIVVMIDGYQAGITFISLAAGLSSGSTYPHLDPTSAFYYTNVYRWTLRYLSLIPFWLGGNGGHFVTTHRVWKRRYYYMDELVPGWLRKLCPFAKQEDWDKEELQFKRFKKYAEPAFGKHYRYPTKLFNDFKSQNTAETIENVDVSSNSIVY